MSRHARARAIISSLALLALPLTPAASAHAAGFAIFEHGARAMGFAGAFTGQADDPSAIFHNAAGIGFLKGRRLSLGGALVQPTTVFRGAAPFPGTEVTEKSDLGVLTLPHAYYTHPFTERMVLGVGLNVPFGLKTQWASPETFSGRFVSQKAELTGFSLNPVVAYRVADRFSVAGGLDVRSSSVTLERRLSVLDPRTQRVVDGAAVRLASDTAYGVGFNVGVLAKPTDSLSVGAQYRHKVKIDYGGSAAFTALPTGNSQLDAGLVATLPSGDQAVRTGIAFPAILTTGAAYRRGDWTFAADVNWYQWSSFQQILIDFEVRTDFDQLIVQAYDDTLQFRLGAERRLSERFALRGGYFYDKSPAPTASVSPLLPDADRHGLALGGSWNPGPWIVDAATWYVRSPERATKDINRDRFEGVYKSRALTLGLTVGRTF